MRVWWNLLFVLVLGCKPAIAELSTPVRARVHCVNVEPRSWSESVLLRGTVQAEPDHDAIVSAQVPGRLVRVMVREGAVVTQNQPLAQLETRPFENALLQARAQIAQVDAAHTAAAAMAERERHLFERGISARQAMETAEAGLLQAAAQRQSAAAMIDIAKQNMERSVVRAPIAGVVVRLLRRTGEVVDGTPVTPVLELADPSSLELAASGSAVDLIRLVKGQKGSVRFDALPNAGLTATVRAVSPSVDPLSGTGSVRLTLRTAGTRPPLGLSGDAVIVTGAARNVLVVPAQAIRNAGGASTEVVVCEAGHARVRQVAVGERKEGFAEITKGVGARERVAVDELMGLEENMALEEQP